MGRVTALMASARAELLAEQEGRQAYVAFERRLDAVIGD